MCHIPLKIAFYNPSVSSEITGGVETFIREIAHRLNAEGNSISIISGRAPVTPEIHSLAKNKIGLHLFPYFRRYLLLNRMLVRILKEIRHEMTPFAVESFSMLPSSFVHFIKHTYDLVSICLPNDCLIKLWLKETPLIIHFQGGIFNRHYIRFLNRYQDVHIIPCSQFVKKELNSLKLNRIWPCVHNGVDPSIFHPNNALRTSIRKKLGISQNKVILYVGRFTYEKGVSHLIHALPKISSNYPNTVLVLIGSGPLLKYYYKLAKQLGVLSQLRIVENIPHSELNSYYNAADIFVLPSYREPFGIVVAEAMACQLPVIASNKGGIPEIVKNGKSGILVPIKDSESITNAINILFADKNLREKMGRFGREIVLKNFTWGIATKRILAQYEDIIKKV